MSKVHQNSYFEYYEMYANLIAYILQIKIFHMNTFICVSGMCVNLLAIKTTVVSQWPKLYPRQFKFH